MKKSCITNLLGFVLLCLLFMGCGSGNDIIDGDQSESENQPDGDEDQIEEDGDQTELDAEDYEDTDNAEDSEDSELDTEEEIEPLDVSVRLSNGETRVGIIAKDEDFIGGPMAKGKIGDYKMYNSKIQVIIEGLRRSDGWGSFGGTIADADIVRGEGVEGESRFSEYFSGFGLRLPDVDNVEIVNDGLNGEAAHLRFTGPDAELPFVESSLSSLLFSTHLDTEIQVDYRLEPDSSLLEIEHSFVWQGESKDTLNYVVQVFILGDGLKNFMHGYGFDKSLHKGESPIYITAGKELTYGFFGEDGNLSLLFNYEGINFYSNGSKEVFPGERISFKRYVAITEGGVNPVMREFDKWAGITDHATIEGTLTDADDNPVSMARIHVTQSSLKADEDYISQAITDENGNFYLELPEGDYLLTPYKEGYEIPEATAVELDNQTTVTQNLELVTPAVFNYEIKDAYDNILPSKIIFDRTEGRIEAPDSFGEMKWHDNHQWVEYSTGSGTINLPAGTYDITVSRGYEYSIHQETITLNSGDEYNFTAEIEQVVETPGYVSSDFHLHSQASPDSDIYYVDRVKSAVAAGVEVPVSTDHDVIISYMPTVEELGLTDWIHPITGLEITTYTYGHFNAWPLEVNPDLPNNGAFDWYFKSAPELFQEVAEHDTNPLLHVCHPRAASIGGYFSSVKYDPETGETGVPDNWSTQFQSIEIINGGDLTTAFNATLPDWYSFLNSGYRFAGSSGSDLHKLVSEVGLVRNWVASSSDDPSELDVHELAQSTVNMNQIVSMGPYVEFNIGEANMGDVVTDTSGQVSLSVKVQAPEWMTVDKLMVIANGEQIKEILFDNTTIDSENPVIRFNDDILVDLSVDTWLIIMVDGSKNLRPVSRASRAFAFTNPIFVDIDGNGEFNAINE